MPHSHPSLSQAWGIRICAAICFQMRLCGGSVIQVSDHDHDGRPCSPLRPTLTQTTLPPRPSTAEQSHSHPNLSQMWGIRICAANCFQKPVCGGAVIQVTDHDQPVHMVTSCQHTRNILGKFDPKLMGPKSTFDLRFVFPTLNVTRIHVLTDLSRGRGRELWSWEIDPHPPTHGPPMVSPPTLPYTGDHPITTTHRRDAPLTANPISCTGVLNPLRSLT